MPIELLYRLNLWPFYIVSVILLLAASEIGFRLGRRAQPSASDVSRSIISTIQGAMLGLLALILGFTFAMSMTRFEARKQLVLEEANAIRSTFLMAQPLPEPQRQELSNLLRQYVEVRLAFYEADDNQQKLKQVNAQTEQLHRQLWSIGAALGKKYPESFPVGGLFLPSLNDMISLHAKIITAWENRVPGPIRVILFFVALMAIGLMGYCCGIGGRRNFLVVTMVAMLTASVITIITDLDQPGKGLIKVSQQRLVDLRQSLAKQ